MKRGAIGLAMALGIVGVGGSARAYRTAEDLPEFTGAGPVRWPSSRVTYSLGSRLASGVAGADVDAAVRAGALVWSVEGEGPTLISDARRVTAVSGDGHNTVEWLEERWAGLGLDASTAAVTDLTYEEVDGRWTLIEADVLFNDADFDWTSQPDDGSDARDIQTIAAHEFGHFVGLLHTCRIGGDGPAPLCSSEASFQEALMFPDYLGTRRQLFPDDAAGVRYLYSTSECRVDSDCASGACRDGACTPACGDTVCVSDETCSDHVCIPASCASCISDCDPRCPEPPPGGYAGQPCGSADECRGMVCAEAGYCTNVCMVDRECRAGWSCDGETGHCDTSLGLFGDACTRPSQCASALCLTSESTSICTDPCATDAECPAMHACRAVSGEPVCVPVVASGGCRTSPGGSSTDGPFLVWLAALAFMTRVRRRRGSIQA